MFVNALPEVYSPRDIAMAAGVPEAQVLSLLQRGEIRSVADFLPGDVDPKWVDFVPHAEAVRAVRALRAGDTVGESANTVLGRLLAPASSRPRATTVPLIVST